jgi:hypothetical protein
MVKAKPSGESSVKQPAPITTWVIYLVFGVIAVSAFLLYNYKQRQELKLVEERTAAEVQRSKELAALNKSAGLPETYPLDFMPLYPGVEFLEAQSEDAKADDGAAMDKWHVLCQTDAPKQDVYDFYMQRLEAEGMRQTMYISLPSGYSLGYADENRIVELRIEKLRSDPKLQVELTVYIVKGAPASKAPYAPADASAAPTSSPPA